MARHALNVLLLLTTLTNVNAYWLMGIENFITTERLDPIVNPGKVSGHVHSVLGGSNFRMNTNTANLRNSECTSIPIPEDKSNYWFPHLYFHLDGGAVICEPLTLSIQSHSVTSAADYLFNDKPGTTTAFPDDFRMLSGDPTLRTYDPNSFAQQAITFLCLDFDGTTTRHNSIPAKSCPSGIRAQVNFPSCWDGKNLDSPDHKSHVAFLSGGPDSGTCSDPKYPVTLPRVFIEVYWASNDFDKIRSQAKNPSQPFVYSYGDPTGYGYHADFLNGWDKGVLQNAVDNCHCNIYGDPSCCVDQGIFHMNKDQHCRITKAIDERTTGTLDKLPGNNPVQNEGVRATMFPDPNSPVLLEPIFAYTGDVPSPAQVGRPVPGSGSSASSSAPSSPSPSSPVPKPPASSPVAVTSSAVAPSFSSRPSPAASSSNAPPPSPSSILVAPTSNPVAPSSPSVPSGDLTPTPLPPTHTTSVAASPSPPTGDPSPSPYPLSSDGATHTSEGDSIHTSNVPLPPSSGTGSNSPGQNPPAHIPPAQHPPHESSPSSPMGTYPTNVPSPSTGSGHGSGPYPDDSHPSNHNPVYPPSVTLIAGGGSGNDHHAPAAPASPASTTPTFPSSGSSSQMCSGRKYRHKLLKAKAQEKRSIRHARSVHNSGRRFTKPHARAF